MRNGVLRVGDHVCVKDPSRWEGNPDGTYVVRKIWQKPGYRKDWLLLAVPGMGAEIGTFSAQDVRQ